jgi:hypothetical protein
MKPSSSQRLAVLLALGCGVSAFAAESTLFRWRLEAGPSIWLKTRVAYGATASPDPAATAKTDRIYDDGFNRVDASGNLGDAGFGPLASRTGYFGFTSDSQVDLRAGTLALHRTTAGEGLYRDAGDTGNRPAWHAALRLSLSKTKPDRRDWGLEGAVDWARFRDRSSGPVSANVRVLTDTYPLGGVVPQRAPYSGRFSPLPGDQRIGDTPSRSVGPVAGTVNGTRAFDGRAVVLRGGFWWELVPSRTIEPRREGDRWSVFLRGGLALIRAKAAFSVDEQAQAPGLPPGPRVAAAGSRSRSDLGYFLGARARRSFSPQWALLAGADFLGGYQLRASQGDRYALLDLSRVWMLSLGLEYAWDARKLP